MRNMQYIRTRTEKYFTFPLFVGLVLFSFAPVHSAWAGEVPGVTARTSTGVVEGRILSQSTGEFLHNAEVRVQGTEISAVSALDGRYRLTHVPAGNVTLVASYTGYAAVSAGVEVVAGRVTARDFEFTGSSVVELQKFNVVAEREGTAKALMEQRTAMTVKNVVASDTYGPLMREGNIGDVLQYVPGLNIIYEIDVPSSVNFNGMHEKYGALLIDGVRTSGATRAPSLQDYSAHATDSIEVNKTNNAAMDADAPAGSVNMRSKSAFQRKGRYLAWDVYMIHNSRIPLTLGKIDGPNDGRSRPLTPSVVLDYSDTFLAGKLGVVLNFSETNNIDGGAFLNTTFNTVPTPVNPAPVVITNLAYGVRDHIFERKGGGVSLEYKLTPLLTLSLRSQVSREFRRRHQRTVSLIAARNNQALGSSETAMLVLPTATNVNRFEVAGGLDYRVKNTHTFAPQLNYVGEKVTLDATFAYTRLGTYFANDRLDGESDEVRTANFQLFNIGWTATREDPGDLAFQFNQTAGPSVYTLSNWRATSLPNNIGRAGNEPTTRNQIGQVNLKYTTDWSWPTWIQTGVKTMKGSYFNVTQAYNWTFLGPTGNRFEAEIPVSIARFDPRVGGNLFSDQFLQLPDRRAIGIMLKEHPEYFVRNPADLTNAANVFPTRSATEYIDAGYVMANTQVGRLSVQGGVRYEHTRTKADSYERNVLETRRGKYGEEFFSGSLRYRFNPRRMAVASFSQSILRPDLSS